MTVVTGDPAQDIRDLCRYSRMGRCHVEGCARPVRLGHQALSKEAAILFAYGPVLERGLERWPDKFSADVLRTLTVTGRELAERVHVRAHTFSRVPHAPTPILAVWRAAVALRCEEVALLDPEWFRTYWGAVDSRGLEVPAQVRQTLVAIGTAGRRAQAS
jgi:hypothetical protein